jgi:multisubunit Na+/H+ antiporter MnhC subunit
MKNAMAVRAIATAIGTFIIINTNSTKKIINVSISQLLLTNEKARNHSG